jgi:transcriptional regulator with XRE-family HTH domain
MLTRGQRIRLALRRQGWSITKLAKALGVQQPVMSTVVNGHRPGEAQLPRIAELLRVPVVWLTSGDEEPEWVKPLCEEMFPKDTEAAMRQPSLVTIPGRLTQLEEAVAQLHARIVAAEQVAAEASARAEAAQAEAERERTRAETAEAAQRTAETEAADMRRTVAHQANLMRILSETTSAPESATG